MEGGGWRVEGGGLRVEGGGWRVEGGGFARGGPWCAGGVLPDRAVGILPERVFIIIIGGYCIEI